MKHIHGHKHNLIYCDVCDTVYCSSCDREWKSSYYSYTWNSPLIGYTWGGTGETGWSWSGTTITTNHNHKEIKK